MQSLHGHPPLDSRKNKTYNIQMERSGAKSVGSTSHAASPMPEETSRFAGISTGQTAGDHGITGEKNVPGVIAGLQVPESSKMPATGSLQEEGKRTSGEGITAARETTDTPRSLPAADADTSTDALDRLAGTFVSATQPHFKRAVPMDDKAKEELHTFVREGASSSHSPHDLALLFLTVRGLRANSLTETPAVLDMLAQNPDLSFAKPPSPAVVELLRDNDIGEYVQGKKPVQYLAQKIMHMKDTDYEELVGLHARLPSSRPASTPVSEEAVRAKMQHLDETVERFKKEKTFDTDQPFWQLPRVERLLYSRDFSTTFSEKQLNELVRTCLPLAVHNPGWAARLPQVQALRENPDVYGPVMEFLQREDKSRVSSLFLRGSQGIPEEELYQARAFQHSTSNTETRGALTLRALELANRQIQEAAGENISLSFWRGGDYSELTERPFREHPVFPYPDSFHGDCSLFPQISFAYKSYGRLRDEPVLYRVPSQTVIDYVALDPSILKDVVSPFTSERGWHALTHELKMSLPLFALPDAQVFQMPPYNRELELRIGQMISEKGCRLPAFQALTSLIRRQWPQT